MARIICSVGLNYQTFLKKATEWSAEFGSPVNPCSKFALDDNTIEFFTVNTKLAEMAILASKDFTAAKTSGGA